MFGGSGSIYGFDGADRFTGVYHPQTHQVVYSNMYRFSCVYYTSTQWVKQLRESKLNHSGYW